MRLKWGYGWVLLVVNAYGRRVVIKVSWLFEERKKDQQWHAAAWGWGKQAPARKGN